MSARARSTHRDTLGSLGRTEAGDVQVMSAGTGIRHAEHNGGEVPLKLFQIWLLPRAGGGRPDWSTRKFPKADRAGSLAVLASGDPSDVDALPIRADARVLGATLMPGNAISYELAEGRYAYLAPARGVVTVNGQRTRDGRRRCRDLRAPARHSGRGRGGDRPRGHRSGALWPRLSHETR